MHIVTRTIFPVFAFKVTHRVILLTLFCKLLTRVATLSGARASSASMARRLCVAEVIWTLTRSGLGLFSVWFVNCYVHVLVTVIVTDRRARVLAMTEVPECELYVPGSPPSALCERHLPAIFGAAGGGGKSQSQSYIALISMAILSSSEQRLVLGDIYKVLARWLPERYNTSTKAWRNSIRHNLSLNECFVKAGRAANGKGRPKRVAYASSF